MQPMNVVGPNHVNILLREGIKIIGFQGGTVVKNPPANAGDTGDVGSIPGLGRSLCPWVSKSQTRLRTRTHTQIINIVFLQ